LQNRAGAAEATGAILQTPSETEADAPVDEFAAEQPAATWTLDTDADLEPGEPTQAFEEIPAFFDTAPTQTTQAKSSGNSGSSDRTSDGDAFARLGINVDRELDSDAASDQTGKTPRRERGPSPQLLVGLGAAAAVVIIGMIVWIVGIGKVQVNVSPSVQGVSVANVVNDTYAAGYAALTGQQLLVQKLYEQSETVPLDSITRTDPPAGTIVNSNTTITVYVSSGPSAVAVPSLLNMTQADATSALVAAGLKLGTVTEANSATVAKGLVIETLPTANTQAAKDSAVNIVVSNGLVNVPDVRNLEITDAESQLTAADVALNVSVTTDAEPCEGTPGTTVLDQSLLPGTAPQGSDIILTVTCNP
jgi:serine/threonine-protein kinase